MSTEDLGYREVLAPSQLMVPGAARYILPGHVRQRQHTLALRKHKRRERRRRLAGRLKSPAS